MSVFASKIWFSVLCIMALLLVSEVGPLMAAGTVPVTIDTFVRGCLGTLCHDRMPVAVDNRTIIRMNRDTPYSMGVFDLSTPLTLTVPDIGGRFQSVLVINEDHYIMKVIYDPGIYVFTREQIGTRYAQLTVRTFVNPNDPADIKAMREAQDGLKVHQESVGTFEVPDWDQASLDGLRKAILSTSPWVPDSKRMFGGPDEVDPVRHLIGTAGGFGGNREEDAIYLNETPARNDGTQPYVLTLDQVPVDGFWSIIVYNKDGFFEAPETTVSVNSVTARKSADGKTTIHFGGNPGSENYLRIMPGWSYMARLYRPRPAILDGTWTFPKAEPAQ